MSFGKINWLPFAFPVYQNSVEKIKSNLLIEWFVTTKKFLTETVLRQLKRLGIGKYDSKYRDRSILKALFGNCGLP